MKKVLLSMLIIIIASVALLNIYQYNQKQKYLHTHKGQVPTSGNNFDSNI